MPNIKSAKKRVKVTATKTLINKAFNSSLKTEIKKANHAAVSYTHLDVYKRQPMACAIPGKIS